MYFVTIRAKIDKSIRRYNETLAESPPDATEEENYIELFVVFPLF